MRRGVRHEGLRVSMLTASYPLPAALSSSRMTAGTASRDEVEVGLMSDHRLLGNPGQRNAVAGIHLDDRAAGAVLGRRLHRGEVSEERLVDFDVVLARMEVDDDVLAEVGGAAGRFGEPEQIGAGRT